MAAAGAGGGGVAGAVLYALGKLENIKGGLNAIGKGLDEVGKSAGTVKRILGMLGDRWIEMQDIAFKTSRTMAMGRDQAMRYDRLLMQTTKDLARQYGLTAQQIADFQKDYATNTGRNIILTQRQTEEVAALSRITDEATAADLIDSFDKVGIGIARATANIGAMQERAKALGLNSTKAVKTFQQNIKLASSYSFKNGVRDIEKMALKATALRMDMNAIMNAADKFMDIEGAISTSANIQMLGGSFAQQFANPMGAMYEAMADPKEFMNRIERTIAGKGTYEAKTGQVKFDPVTMMQLREMAKQLGMSVDQLTEPAMVKTQNEKIDAEFRRNANYSQFSDIEKEAIRNLSRNNVNEETGQHQITFLDENGREQTVKIEELTKEQLAVAQDRQMTEEAMFNDVQDIKDILERTLGRARGVTSTKENITGLKEEWNSFLSQFQNFYMGMFSGWMNGSSFQPWDAFKGLSGGRWGGPGYVDMGTHGTEGFGNVLGDIWDAINPFAEGGIVRANAGALLPPTIVPGDSYAGDRVPVMANSGEMIINQRQQKGLFDFIGDVAKTGLSIFLGNKIGNKLGVKGFGTWNTLGSILGGNGVPDLGGMAGSLASLWMGNKLGLIKPGMMNPMSMIMMQMMGMNPMMMGMMGSMMNPMMMGGIMNPMMMGMNPMMSLMPMAGRGGFGGLLGNIASLWLGRKMGMNPMSMMMMQMMGGGFNPMMMGMDPMSMMMGGGFPGIDIFDMFSRRNGGVTSLPQKALPAKTGGFLREGVDYVEITDDDAAQNALDTTSGKKQGRFKAWRQRQAARMSNWGRGIKGFISKNIAAPFKDLFRDMKRGFGNVFKTINTRATGLFSSAKNILGRSFLGKGFNALKGLFKSSKAISAVSTASKASRALTVAGNAGKAASAIGKVGKFAKLGGKAIPVVGTALTVLGAGMEISEANQNWKAQEAAINASGMSKMEKARALDSAEKEKNKSVGGSIGAAGGALAGAAIGSVIPGIGTLIGGAIGGLVGMFGGKAIGRGIGGLFGGGREKKLQEQQGAATGDASIYEGEGIDKAINILASIDSKLYGISKAKGSGGGLFGNAFEHIISLSPIGIAAKALSGKSLAEALLPPPFGIAAKLLGAKKNDKKSIEIGRLAIGKLEIDESLFEPSKESHFGKYVVREKPDEQKYHKVRPSTSSASEKNGGTEKPTDINLNINGSIRLESPNGKSADVDISKLLDNPDFKRQLSEIVVNRLNEMSNAGKRNMESERNNMASQYDRAGK